MNLFRKSVVLLLMLLLASVAFGESKSHFISKALPHYKPAKLKKQKLSSIGSDSMAGLMELWIKEYKKFQPEVEISALSKGSAYAPPALMEGLADVGPMARRMKQKELKEFYSRYGFEPTAIQTALAAIGIYVSKSNPLDSISLEELDAIYSNAPKRGKGIKITSWKDLGIKGPLAAKHIVPLGSDKSSYLNAYFKQKVMLISDFSESFSGVSSANSIVEALRANDAAIAFGPLGLENNKDIKLLRVSLKKGVQGVYPTLNALSKGTYPLSHYLNIYVVRYPGEPLDKATADFLRFIISQEGQKIVEKQGFIALPVEVYKRNIARLQ